MRLTIDALVELARHAMGALKSKTNSVNRHRRAFLAASALTAAAVALPTGSANAAEAPSWAKQNWVGTWSTAPAGPPLPANVQQFSGQTLRLIVHTTIGGSEVRVRLSNELSTAPLRIGAAHVALRQVGEAIQPATDRVLTFSGSTSITIPPGAPALSDPIPLPVPALSDLAVSIFLPDTVQGNTIHSSAFQTNYVSAPGDYTGAGVLPVQRAITSWPFLTGVDVVSANLGASIVALGDSITDGSNTMRDTNHRWTDLLAQRLQSSRQSLNPIGGVIGQLFPNLLGNTSILGVLNKGIGGNRLLRDPGEQPTFGRAALARFDRDVLAQAGVEYLIVLIGINDIGHPGTGTIPLSEAVTANDLITGYRQLIARAHEKGITVFGATLTPFEPTTIANFYSPQKETVRQQVNQWIRNSGEFDAVIDFEAAVRDPAQPTRMLAAYDSGDHLHPNDAGMQAMANAIPLTLFRDNGFARLRDLLRW
jgi:lysophospholipase L1-like esterase